MKIVKQVEGWLIVPATETEDEILSGIISELKQEYGKISASPATHGPLRCP